jgi:MFS family permease
VTSAQRSPWLVFSAVAFGNFMATLDGSIVNVALPSIGADLGASLGQLAWVVTAFLGTAALSLLPLGVAGDRLGAGRVYQAGMALFTVASLLCGLAPSYGVLVAARALQALGAAAMMAIGAGLVTAAFPPAQRGRAIGAIGSVVAIGLTIGPPLGGLITQALSWRWIFLVNLPVGLLGLLWGARVLPRGAPRPAGPARGLGLDVLRRPAFSFGLVGGVASYAAMFASALLTPFYLTHVRGLSPGHVGAVLIAVPVTMSVVAPLAGALSDGLGVRRLTALGAAVLAAGLFALSLAGPDDPIATVAARLALCGMGMGLFQAPNNSGVMGALPRERLGIGGGLLAVSRSTGQVLGVQVASAIVALVAGPAPAPAAFLVGFGWALRGGAAFAVAAGAVSLLAPRPRPSGAPHPP